MTDEDGYNQTPAEEQREMMEILSQETRHSLIMAILGHPHHLASRTELEEMVSKSSGAINDGLDRLQKEGVMDKYEIETPNNPNERDYPTSFWGPTRRGIRILHEYNYLQLLPTQRALYDSSDKSKKMERHRRADRPPLPDDIKESLKFDVGESNQDERDNRTFSEQAENDQIDSRKHNKESKKSDDPSSEKFPELIKDSSDSGKSGQKSRNESTGPRIVIVGCGGAGNNTINRLSDLGGVDGAETVGLNTDKQHLKMIQADTKILVGKSLTQGLGAGGDPSMGERATEMAQETIKQVLDNADLVFVTAGMGGGTGTGAAPVVSEIAKEQGATIVAMVSTPLNVERARVVKAEEGLERLRNKADSIIVLNNNRLLDYVPNLPIGKAFSVMDQIIAETIKEISETITQPSLINLDYADMSKIMDYGGVAVMLVGETQDKNKTQEVVNDALNHPLLDVDYRGASGGLVHITGGPDLTLTDAEGIANNITERLEASTNVIWGARIQDEYKGKVRVMAIMTGIQSAQVINLNSENRIESDWGLEGKKPESDSSLDNFTSLEPAALKELSAFQRDILYVISDLHTPHGLKIKYALEDYYDEEVNTGRVFQNLAELVDKDYLEKSTINEEVNSYNLTEKARITPNLPKDFKIHSDKLGKGL